MEYLYELKEESGFKGCLTIVIPNMKEQFKILKELNIKTSEGKMAFSDQIDTVEKQLELCQKHVKEVDIKHIVSGKEFKKIEDMFYFKQTRELLLNEVASMIINGVDLGK